MFTLLVLFVFIMTDHLAKQRGILGAQWLRHGEIVGGGGREKEEERE